MSKYKVVIIGDDGSEEYLMADGSYDDAVFDDYDEAEEAALQALSDMRAGAEILNMSNPGDYPFDEDDFNPDYRIEDFDE